MISITAVVDLMSHEVMQRSLRQVRLNKSRLYRQNTRLIDLRCGIVEALTEIAGALPGVETQLANLEILAKAPDANHLEDAIPKTEVYVSKQVNARRTGRVHVEKLLISQMLSREVSEKSSYSSASERLPAVQENDVHS